MIVIGNTKKSVTVNKNINGKTKINKNTDIKIEKEELNKKFKCSCCENEYTKQQGNFIPSNFEIFKGNNGFVTTCKNCTDKLFVQLTEFFSGNEEKAIEYMSQMFGLYFNESPLTASSKISLNRSRFSTYVSKIQINPWIGRTFLDTVKERIEEEDKDIITTFDDLKDKKTKLKTVKFFGTGFSDEDYSFLEDEYADWTTRHECSTKTQEEVFKQICYAQLDILKAKRQGQPTKDLAKTFQDLLLTANLQPKQMKDNTLTEQNTFGTLIRKWENEKPIPEPDEEWKDVDGIVRYITVYFLGHLCKMMGIKNSYSRMYEEEMNKYKVEKPEYEDDDEALFDAVFGGALDDSDE